MRSRAARLFSSVLACIALGAAAFFLNVTEHGLHGRRTAVREFDRRAREGATRISEARAGQQAYVAAGQSASVSMPKVAALISETADTVDGLRRLAASNEARMALLAASATIAEFANIDKRARDYLSADQLLMASDVVFAEGGDASANAAQQIESARLAELLAFDVHEADRRRLEAYTMGGATGFTALILLVLSIGRGQRAHGRTGSDISLSSEHGPADPSPGESERPHLAPVPAIREDAPDRAALALNAAAELCTEFGRLRDLSGLKRLLARSAGAMDARGLVVWLGSADGADLRPVAAHGYSDQVLALMRPVPRNADNAAAAAYRTGALQSVPAKPGTSLGAVVAPIVGADGCMGAFAAEIKDNGEVSETVHALASIFAAQLAGILSPAQADAPGVEAASA